MLVHFAVSIHRSSPLTPLHPKYCHMDTLCFLMCQAGVGRYIFMWTYGPFPPGSFKNQMKWSGHFVSIMCLAEVGGGCNKQVRALATHAWMTNRCKIDIRFASVSLTNNETWKKNSRPDCPWVFRFCVFLMCWADNNISGICWTDVLTGWLAHNAID